MVEKNLASVASGNNPCTSSCTSGSSRCNPSFAITVRVHLPVLLESVHTLWYCISLCTTSDISGCSPSTPSGAVGSSLCSDLTIWVPVREITQQWKWDPDCQITSVYTFQFHSILSTYLVPVELFRVHLPVPVEAFRVHLLVPVEAFRVHLPVLY